MGRPAGPPTDDPPGVCIDDEGDVHEPRPGRDVGKVRHQQHVQRWRVEPAIDVIEWARREFVADGRAHRLAKDHPASPISRINRATVQRSTGKPSLIICRQTLRMP